jgi:hypothetical protein
MWGHEETVFMNAPGKAFKQWTAALGLTYRIKAALGVRKALVLLPTALTMLSRLQTSYVKCPMCDKL